MLSGVDQLANAVRVTLGPKGRNVVIEKSFGSPTVTKDGVTVAKEIELEDKFENMGAQMVKEVASKTSDVAGDGTTTATVLAQAIFREGSKLVVAGMNPMELKRGIDTAVAAIVEELSKQSKPTRDASEIAQVGTISANNDETIGAILAEAMSKVGKEGVITVEEAKSMDTVLDVVEGMQFDRGYLSPYFVTDPERMEATLEEPLILLHEKKISSMKDLLPLLEQVARQGKPLADRRRGHRGRGARDARREQDPRHAQRRRGEGARLRRSPQGDAPGHGDPHRRPGDRRGARPQARERDAQGPRQGQAVVIDKDNTTIIDGAGKKSDIEGRCNEIRNQIEDTTSDYDREKLQERLAKLVGGVAVVKVGAATETEMKEKKARVEDALHATRAAVEEGIVPGRRRGAAALPEGARGPRRERGAARRREHHPARGRGAAARIAENAGIDGSIVVDKVKNAKGALRLQRAHRGVRGPAQGRRDRPDQGRAHGAPERRERRVAAADHRGDGGREARGEGRAAARRAACPAAWAE